MTNDYRIQTNYKWILPIVFAAALVFSNALNGEFVYNDKQQILQNPLIQNTDLYGNALVSDIWAFNSDGSVAASNYWRPTFTAWSILNYLLLGPDPFGWHIANVFLHLAVCVLAFMFLLRLTGDQFAAFFIALIFAVHPVHTEPIVWISGSSDLLFAFFFLLSAIFALRFAESGEKGDLWAAAAAFVPALGAKEIALLSIPIFYFLLARKRDSSGPPPSGLQPITPFVVLGAAYFGLRLFIIGQLKINTPDAAGFGSALLTAPSLFLFYLKQTLFPVVLGPNYPIRPVEEFTVTFAIVLVISLLLLAAMFFAARRSRVQAVGLTIFFLPLAAAFDITAFSHERIAHDRYLYLPVLGFLMIVIPELICAGEMISKAYSKKVLFGLLLAIAVLYGFMSYRYSNVWLNDNALWTHSIAVNPESAFNYAQLGAVFLETGSPVGESIRAYNRSLDINPSPRAYLGRARGFIDQRKFEEAVWDLKTAAEMPTDEVKSDTLLQIYETLDIAYSLKNRHQQAEKSLREAIKRLPNFAATLTARLSVALYEQDRVDDAVKELESVKLRARTELAPGAKAVLLRLGALYVELDKKKEAQEVLKQYLVLTRNLTDKATLDDRKRAMIYLERSKTDD